ncbi:MAG TPA: hypothetical protein VKP30_12350 [Polyangiaceae bacterium]|nr:hypothetical protein [Polyangiaceae bacterium]
MRVSLEYRKVADCPDESWFVARIGTRTRRVHFEPRDQAALLHLQIAVSSEPLEGWLDLRGPDLVPLVRRVSGRTCEEIADALSLIVAMTLDPTVAPVAPATPETSSLSAATASTAPNEAVHEAATSLAPASADEQLPSRTEASIPFPSRPLVPLVPPVPRPVLRRPQSSRTPENAKKHPRRRTSPLGLERQWQVAWLPT